jgi:low temperature requirement protein LtrA
LVTPDEGTKGLLRPRDASGSRVTFVELFFDLVYVFAITQLSQLLLGHLTIRGAAESLVLLLAVWWAWIDTSWVTNWFDPDHPAVRLLLVGIMLASLVMSASLPDAFGGRGLVFAAMYAAMEVGRPLFVVAALPLGNELRRNFQRILVWRGAGAAIWLAGGFGHGSARAGLWVAAVVVDFVAPLVGFATPRLGRSHTREWTIAGSHMAERCQLFITIALGESILVSGATFGELHLTAASATALVVAFASSVALWWIYFYRMAEWGSAVMSAAADPGRLGRSAYTYFHVPMVAGIIVTAVADELTIAHPGAHGTGAIAAVALGGPALYLLGNALYKRVMSGRWLASRAVAIAALAALVPVALVVPALVTSLTATLIVVAVAVWETRAARSLTLSKATG